MPDLTAGSMKNEIRHFQSWLTRSLGQEIPRGRNKIAPIVLELNPGESLSDGRIGALGVFDNKAQGIQAIKTRDGHYLLDQTARN